MWCWGLLLPRSVVVCVKRSLSSAALLCTDFRFLLLKAQSVISRCTVLTPGGTVSLPLVARTFTQHKITSAKMTVYHS